MRAVPTEIIISLMPGSRTGMDRGMAWLPCPSHGNTLRASEPRFLLKGIHRCGTASCKEQVYSLGLLRLENRYLRRSMTETCELRSSLERVSVKGQLSSHLFQYKNSRSPNEPGRLQSDNRQGYFFTPG